MTQKLNLVIVAGGIGSRLAPCTSHIPKFLVNIGKQTGYVEMIRYWKQYTSFQRDDKRVFGTLTVIVHSTYASLVQAYHDLYFNDIPLTIKCVDVALGSAHAIISACQHLEGESVFFQWCDVYPVDKIPVDEMVERYNGANVVFTNYNNSNRYGLTQVGEGWANVTPVLMPDEDGGIFGLYYINRFHTNAKWAQGQDFVEIIEQYGAIREHKLNQIVDFGDMPKLIRTRAVQDEAREFNTIEFIDNYVLKAATNNQGQDIIAKEIAWYETLALLNKEKLEVPLPKVWVSPTRDSFFMTRASGVPIWKAWEDFSPVDRKFVLEQVIQGQDKLFQLGKRRVMLHQILEDVRVEAGSKLRKRYYEIENVIKAFGPVQSVNGYVLKEDDPIVTINELEDVLVRHYTRNYEKIDYGFIHGDLQFSNAMVDIETRKVTIIDPRGYFGTTTGYGLQDYDIGKLLYALSGYDNFNYNKKFGICLHDGELKFTIDEPSHAGIEGIVEQHFKQQHHVWLAVCWLGLAQYIKNDPVKSLAAHYHGLALAEQVLRKS